MLLNKKLISKHKPKISVIMPVYNGEKYLHESIDSILQQSFSDFEFIIINDGSTDNSLQIIKSYQDIRIVIIDQANQGVAKSLNNGIEIARGKYIARMDADDISYKDRFSIQFKFLEENNNVIVVGSNADIIDKDGNYVYTTTQLRSNDDLKKLLPYKSPFIHPSVMIRADILIKIGFYPVTPMAQDLFMFNKMSGYGKYANIVKPLIKYRLTPVASSSRSKNTKNIIANAITYFYENGQITADHVKRMRESIINTNINYKYYLYHLHLAKKYLWNNCQPQLARKNIFIALRYNMYNINLIFLYFLSFLNSSSIKYIYRLFKNK